MISMITTWASGHDGVYLVNDPRHAYHLIKKLASNDRFVRAYVPYPNPRVEGGLTISKDDVINRSDVFESLRTAGRSTATARPQVDRGHPAMTEVVSAPPVAGVLVKRDWVTPAQWREAALRNGLGFLISKHHPERTDRLRLDQAEQRFVASVARYATSVGVFPIEAYRLLHDDLMARYYAQYPAEQPAISNTK